MMGAQCQVLPISKGREAITNSCIDDAVNHRNNIELPNIILIIPHCAEISSLAQEILQFSPLIDLIEFKPKMPLVSLF